jgi:hypothetical protein
VPYVRTVKTKSGATAAAGQRIAAGGDGVFRQLVLARISEPASKIDSFKPTQAGNVGSAACAS